VGVLTISDRLSQHNTNLVYENKSLPIMESYFTKENGFEIVHRNAVPDTKSIIQDQLLRLSESASAICDVIITTGGTGFAPRDVTPEATVEVLHRQAPQLSALMLHGYMDSKPMVALSRGVCGIRNRTLICNLPGSPKGVNECLTKLMPVLEHACHTMLDWNGHVTAVHGDWKPTAMHLPGGGGEEEVVKTSTTDGHHHCHHHPQHQIHSPLAQSPTTASPSVVVANRHRKSPWPLIGVGEALQHVRREARGQDWRTALVQREVSSALLGMWLGEDICAPCHFPPFPTSLKDGYAIRSADGSGVYQVLGTVTAGEVPESENDSETESKTNMNTDPPPKKATITRRSLQPFECWRITTGAVLPSFLAADAVAMVEFSELVEANSEGEEVQIRMQFPSHAEGKEKGKLSAGTDIRPTGSDWKQGTRLLRQGTVLDAAGLGLLAAIGMTSVKVYEPLTVGVLSTGNEIVNASDLPLAAREAVNDSNRPMLLGLLRREPGVEVLDLGIAPDRKDAIKQVLQQSFSRCHLVISTGGASMGELDFIKTILEEYQATLHFGRVKMKPGKPTTFATLHTTTREERVEEGKRERKCLFFGLPGNPVSAYCTYHLFALEAIRSWNRQSEPLSMTPQTDGPSGCPRIQVRWRGNDPIRYDAERAEYYRAIVYVNPLGELVAQRPPGEPMSLGSSNIWNCVGSNALLELPCKEGQLDVGEMCMALMTGPIALE
jgi:gephyrin